MEQTMKEIRTKNPLGYQPIGRLLMKFAIPSVISMLVNAVYNIVDQIFIGQGVGYLGNAATTVAFPIVTIILAVGTMLYMATFGLPSQRAILLRPIPSRLKTVPSSMMLA